MPSRPRAATILDVSRSIHETRRALEEHLRWDHPDHRRRAEEAWILRRRLRQKSRYKQRSAGVRALQAPPRSALRRVGILTEEPHAHIHHPLDADDIRALLDALPGDVRAEVAAVRLRSGFREEVQPDQGYEPDPWTGRPGHAMCNVVWTPRLLGRCWPACGEIDLFGYAYDVAGLRVPEVQLTLLWLMQAQTFAHEVAHCWDGVARSKRDRWAADDRHRAESYAERMAREWLASAVLPVFRRRHAVLAGAFDDWVRTHVGVALPVERVAGDVDRSLWGAVVGLWEMTAEWSGEAELDARVAFAEQLHFVDDHAVASEIVQTVLSLDPAHVGASILLGDIAVHQEDWERALALTARALQLAPSAADAHEDRIGALMGARRWADAVRACDVALQLPKDSMDGHRRLITVLHRARSRLELGDEEGALADLDLLPEQGEREVRNRGVALRASILLRRGDCRGVVELTETALREQVATGIRAVIVAERWIAYRRLGQQPASPIPTARQVDLLRWNGWEALAAELLALGLQPAVPRITRRQADANAARGPFVRP